ncbi:hypothetical protein AB0D49_07555 [Streptomyces sp. NPDC048290]|uniref:recombination directionality factor n=1 Tax=Streptomyces sp. NPDC048290 TaxID=3155811 RepID=UPI00343D3E23
MREASAPPPAYSLKPDGKRIGMTQSTASQVGRFHAGRISEGLPRALDAWCVTTDDVATATRIADLLGGEVQPNEADGGLAYEVLTTHESVRVLVDGPDALASDLILWRGHDVVHHCDGVDFLSPEEKKGQPCGCPRLLEDRKTEAKRGSGPSPSIDLIFRIAAAPTLGEFRFRSGSWKLAEQLGKLDEALRHVDGPAMCELTLELVLYTTKMGRHVGYRKPVLTVLGSPDTVPAEPPPTAEPTPPPASSGPSRRTNRSPGSTAPALTAPPLSASVDVDTVLLRRAAELLGTSGHQETVTAALSTVLESKHHSLELERLRKQVGHIASIADQALRGESSPAYRSEDTIS